MPEAPARAGAPLTPAAARRRQRQRNLAIALGLVLLIVLFYAITVVKFGAGLALKPA